MRTKQWLLAAAAVLAVGGAWFTRSAWRPPAGAGSTLHAGRAMPEGPSLPAASGDPRGAPPPSGDRAPERPVDRPLRPPDPARRFIDFTPEERVDFARRGHGPGG